MWAAAVLPASLNGTARAADDETVIVALGDSLTAGFGVVDSDSFPVRLEAALRDAGANVRVVNAGVSGDTSAGGLARVDWVLVDKPDLVIVELGANDGLRGLEPADMEANLGAILTRLGDKGIPAVLTGMLAPPNMGRAYGIAFMAVYPRLPNATRSFSIPSFSRVWRRSRRSTSPTVFIPIRRECVSLSKILRPSF